MSNKNYVGATQRTFRHALPHLLATEYGLLGSQRILQVLVEDIQALVTAFHPTPAYLAQGWMLYPGTRATGPKAYPGQTAAQHDLVMVAWPVCLPEEATHLATAPATRQAHQALVQQRLVRLVEYGWAQTPIPLLLSLADLALMTGQDSGTVSKLLQAARTTTGKPLLTKGYFFDQGVQPPHKADIIALYEQGLDETEIARQTQHAQDSVGHYLRDYARVKGLGQQHIPETDWPHLLDMRPSVIQAYVALIEKYHPEWRH